MCFRILFLSFPSEFYFYRVLQNPSAHNHAPDQAQIEAKKLVGGLKRKCAQEPERPAKQIYDGLFRDLKALDDDRQELAAHLPQYHRIKSSLYRQKRKLLLPPLLQRGQDTVIKLEPPPFSETAPDGRTRRRFLLADAGGQDKILVFGTDESVLRMCASERKKVFMGGTFWVTPELHVHSIIQDSAHFFLSWGGASSNFVSSA